MKKDIKKIPLIREIRSFLKWMIYQRNKGMNGRNLFLALNDYCYRKTGRRLNITEPVTYDEKIQWLKLYDSTPLKTKLADKYLVREYVRDTIGERYLTKLLGVYRSFDEIDLSILPDRFVMKANHGSKWNIIVKDKNSLNIKEARRRFGKWLKMNFAYCNGFELHYRDIEPCIIIEEYLENRSGELPDYKISCFGGKPELIQYINRRPEGLQIAVYDTGWRKTDIAFGRKEINADIPRPECLEELLKAAEKLSAPFSFVRVDMYVLDSGEIKFGEMTFTPASGVHRWSDMQHDEMLGKMIKLPEKYCLPGIDYRFDR